MRILCAPDSFKESLSASQACLAMQAGIRNAAAALNAEIEVDLCPVADGGEGTVETLCRATGGTIQQAQVTGPLGETVTAQWGLLPDEKTAVIGAALACGLHLIPPDKRNPEMTTTYGLGELIRRALDQGCTKIIAGLGGSGTTDGGAGMAAALGAVFQGAPEKVRGGDLADIQKIDLSQLDERLRQTTIRVACDVNNPLCGPEGAAAVYSPQKGATPEQVKRLDAGLKHLAELMHADADTPGFGSAGGLGFGMAAFLGASLEPGAEMILDVLDFSRRCLDADLVLTGEGQLDGQSMQGKAVTTIARLAHEQKKPTVALVGSIGEGAEVCFDRKQGGYLTSGRSIINKPLTLEQAVAEAESLLAQAAEQVVRLWLVAGRITGDE